MGAFWRRWFSLRACVAFLFFDFIEVVGQVAGEHARVFIRAELHCFLDDGVEKVSVVRNDEEGAGVVDECFLQDVLRLHVEVVGGLVENEEVGGADEHANKGDAGTFATTQDADFFEDIVPSEEEAAEDIARGHGGAAGLDLFDGFENRQGGFEFVGMVLIEEGGEGFGAEFVVAGERGLFPGDHAAEGGLAGAVGADDGDFFTTGDFEVEVPKDGEVAVLLGGVFELRNKMGGGGRVGKTERHHRILCVDLDAFDFGELFDARLDLRGFVGLGAEAVDKLFGFGDLAVLVYLLFAEVVLALLELGFVGRVVAGEFLGAAVVEGDGAGGETVHHGAVVRDENDGALVAVEVGFHEALRVNVEVVGGFIQEEDFGLGEEELGHGDAHLPAAGEFAAIAIKVVVLEAKSGEDRLDFRSHAGWVVAVEPEFEFADFIEEVGEGGGARVEFFELGGVAVDVFLDGLGFSKGGLDFIIKRDALDMDPFLGKVADTVMLWFGDFAGVGFENAADTLHESGLAGSIVSGEGNALLLSYGKGKVFENDTGSEFHTEVFDCEHAGGLVETRGI